MTPHERWEKRQDIFGALQEEDIHHQLALALTERAYHQSLASEHDRHMEAVREIQESLNDEG